MNMKRNVFVGLLLVVLVLALSGCASVRLPESDAVDAPIGLAVSDAAGEQADDVVAVEAEGTEEELPASTVVALVVIVVVLALANERLVEGLKKAGVIKDNGQSAAWQSIFGGLSIVALSLAKYLGIEGLITLPVNQLVEVASFFVLLIPMFAQAGLAKLFHELWKKIGWVATTKKDAKANQVAARAG
jgi:hypothetical protein